MQDIKRLCNYLGHKTEVLLSSKKYNYDGMRQVISPQHLLDYYNNECEIKLILRPLSDLAKEIEVKGKKFIPADFLSIEYSNKMNVRQIVSEGYINSINTLNTWSVPYWIIELLLKWNFDIFGLIEKGLAVDINSL